MQKTVLLPFLFFLSIACLSFAQESDSSKTNYISGAASLTNNGISLIPSFSLEKPAALFNMSIEKDRFSFDPEVTFSLEGKPWYMLFWFRYQLVNADKFQMKVGTHLGLNFVDKVLPIITNPTEVIVAERFLVGELSPNYSITNNINVGIYYLLVRGFDIGTKEFTHFISLNSTFSNITFSKKLFMRVTPQFYYLKLYGDEGFYFTSTFTLGKSNFPVTVSSTINKVIKTDIAAGKDFLWNLTLTYSFGKRHIVSSFPASSIQESVPSKGNN